MSVPIPDVAGRPSSASDPARRRLRLTVYAGAALIVMVWIAATLSFGQRVAALQTTSSAVGRRYVDAQQLLTEARTQVLVAAISLRESLLEPDVVQAEDRRREVANGLERAETLLAAYVPIMTGSDEAARVSELHRDIGALSAEVEKVALRGATRGVESLRRELAPKRQAVVQLADEIGRLNRSAYVAYQVETVALSRRLQRQLVQILGLAFVASLGVGALSFRRVVRLELELRQRAADEEQLRRELRALTASLIRVREDERRTIARDLHDEVGQMLLAAKVELGGAEQSTDSTRQDRIVEARQMVEYALAATRDVSRVLHPAILEDLGLVEAIGELARRARERYGLDVRFEHSGFSGRLPPHVELAAYRVVQEALTNVARHARATSSWVRAIVEPDHLIVGITDDGQGLPAALRSGGLGLVGIRERVIQVGGIVDVQSTPGLGTSISARLPLAGQRSGSSAWVQTLEEEVR